MWESLGRVTFFSCATGSTLITFHLFHSNVVDVNPPLAQDAAFVAALLERGLSPAVAARLAPMGPARIVDSLDTQREAFRRDCVPLVNPAVAGTRGDELLGR